MTVVITRKNIMVVQENKHEVQCFQLDHTVFAKQYVGTNLYYFSGMEVWVYFLNEFDVEFIDIIQKLCFSTVLKIRRVFFEVKIDRIVVF